MASGSALQRTCFFVGSTSMMVLNEDNNGNKIPPSIDLEVFNFKKGVSLRFLFLKMSLPLNLELRSPGVLGFLSKDDKIVSCKVMISSQISSKN